MAQTRVKRVQVVITYMDDRGVDREMVLLDKTREHGFGTDFSFKASRPLVPQNGGFRQDGPIAFDLHLEDWSENGKLLP